MSKVKAHNSRVHYGSASEGQSHIEPAVFNNKCRLLRSIVYKGEEIQEYKENQNLRGGFVCFSTKAVHLELVSELTSDAFLAALKRFFARRGKSTDMYSDNGINFVGADRELKRMYNVISLQEPNEYLSKHLSDQRVRWHFIPRVHHTLVDCGKPP